MDRVEDSGSLDDSSNLSRGTLGVESVIIHILGEVA